MRYWDFDEDLHFVQNEYGRQPTFSSFLPGIAGPWGIPAWCNYNNRGQGVCSFGVLDKDHAILEFTGASTAYQRTALTGFRTFIKHNTQVVEPFADGVGRMIIEPNVLSILWNGDQFRAEVQYYTLPNERMAGLCRKLRITNEAEHDRHIELLDGLATIVPYGVKDKKLKQEPNLSTAWMQTDWLENGIPCFRVRASLEDTAKVSRVEGCNFRIAISDDGLFLPAIVQPSLVFGWDTAMVEPRSFANTSLNELLGAVQLSGNYLPCCMSAWEGVISSGQSVEIWEFYGQAENDSQVEAFSRKADKCSYYERKLQEARSLVKQITSATECETANPVFDRYVEQNFLDNVMRGGFPYALSEAPNSLPLYLYSRKHGDPEREYNFFSLDRTYFSQGNANFRDICQNRRSDVMFHPKAGAFNLQLFFELIQTDGYNPLVIEPVSYRVNRPDDLIQLVDPADRKQAQERLSGYFSFGQLAMEAEQWNLLDFDSFLSAVIENSEMEPNARFQEGYWSDHWTYLMDLIESELSVFPEQEQDLLFHNRNFRWFSRNATVKPQAERYVLTANGIRQYNCIKDEACENKWVLTTDGKPAYSTLFEKLLLLSAIKSATLDLSGAAVEMEGGKPGWYDALNGLPGLLGSSVADGCELLRILDYLHGRVVFYGKEIEVYEEIAQLLKDISYLSVSNAAPHDIWIARNQIRDKYRKQTQNGFSGVRVQLTADEVIYMLQVLSDTLRTSINTVIAENNGICPTYFYYSAEKTENETIPAELTKVILPLFLEGPTRWLRTEQQKNKKRQMVSAVSHSPLLDPKLQMYKLNESLADVSFEVGRTRAFPPGWLENESIWLHMEYKYLYALLECEMYDHFFTDFRNIAIPFLSPDMYKRSTLENSSFLVSSANQDVQSHGQGYVSRLSGSTAEFIAIWNLMFFGKNPFENTAGGLQLHFKPAIPDYLIGDRNTISATFLGKTKVVYHLKGLKELVPGNYTIEFCMIDQSRKLSGEAILNECARTIRERKVNRIDVFFRKA